MRILGDDGAVTTYDWTIDEEQLARQLAHPDLYANEMLGMTMTRKVYSYLVLHFPVAKSPRAINAVKYFTSKFCRGKSSAF